MAYTVPYQQSAPRDNDMTALAVAVWIIMTPVLIFCVIKIASLIGDSATQNEVVQPQDQPTIFVNTTGHPVCADLNRNPYASTAWQPDEC